MECRAYELMDLSESTSGLSSCIESLGLPSSFKHSNSERKQNNLLLKLGRIRDVISLWLSYPMRTVHDSKLKTWIHRVSNVHGIAETLCLIQENPLRSLEALVPIEMMIDNDEMEADGSPMFDHDDYEIPDAILNLAADLAVDQLVQTLLSGDDHVHNIHHVMISTRNNDEQREVYQKMKVVLKDTDNMPRFNEIFHGVLWVDVSKYPGQAKVEVLVEEQICLQLQLPIFRQSNLQRMISKKFLVLLLDGDAEKTIHPQKVRLPSYIREAAVMVLITTEFQKQANDEKTMAMDLTISTKDHLLPWKVFGQNVGKKFVYLSNAIQKIAVCLVQECAGHLLAIVLVAKSLKNVEDVELWELALYKLSRLYPSYDMNRFHGVTKVMVTAFINFFWNDMNQTLKHCLASCLFIPNIKIGKFSDELMHHWIAHRLTDDQDAMYNLRELVERSILLQLDHMYVQLPKDTFAILDSLNTLTPLFMKKSGLGLTEPPKDELWHAVVHMELANNKLSELKLSPNSPELQELMLQGNAELTRIPEMFFFKMPLLWILDLSYTSVRELPDSLFELEQLKELYLKGCECFMKLSSKIGKLKKLEKLDLDGTQIIHLPEETQELTNLQSLILCFYEYRGKKSKQYTCSTIIPSKVISKLKGLKHLSIDVNPDDERWYENVLDILPEILGLKKLLTLSLYIPHLELLKPIPAHIFEVDFRFIVGRHIQRIISSTPSTWEAKFKQSDCSLKFVNGHDIPSEIEQLVRHSKALYLERHKTIKNLSEFKMMNLEQLRVCMLAECREMQTIVDGRMSDSDNDIFSHLLYLYISQMKSLRSIWEGPIPPLCFLGMLKSLVLQNCPELTIVFTLDFLGNLSLLKELIVKDCPKITTLISDGSFKHKGEIYLCKLKKILLLHLPKLINISNGCEIGPSLESMAIYNCPKLQSLSKMELSSQNLKVIKGETKWWDSLQWNEEEWGMAYRPSIFDNIFSSINNQVDIITQFGVDDDDIDDDLAESMDNRRRTADTWTEISHTTEDRHAWRKYRQKEILAKSAYRRRTDNRRRTADTWTKISHTTEDRHVRRKYGQKEILAKARRGCYQRRRTADTWTKISHTTEDEHTWRKYGQKEILNCKFPWCYFRCTRKHDQGCKAVKQVKRIEENPEKYLTTYIGCHTCKDTLKPEMVSDSGNWESYLVPESKVPNDDQKKVRGPALISSSSTPTIKQEYPKEDAPLSEITDNWGTPLGEITDNWDPSLWSDLNFDLSEPLIKID